MAQVVKKLPANGREDPLEKEMVTYCSILAWRLYDRGAWWAAVYRVAQNQTRLKRLRMHAYFTLIFLIFT